MSDANAAVDLEALRFPLGPFSSPPTPLASEERERLIGGITAAPSALRACVAGLDEEQLDTRYRPGGWTARQVVHHVADSHVNGYVRFKLAATEVVPTIRIYDGTAWGEQGDARELDVEVSLRILDALHVRWTRWMRTLSAEEWRRELDHPESGRMNLDALLALYEWHGRHHVAHITTLRDRNGW